MHTCMLEKRKDGSLHKSIIIILQNYVLTISSVIIIMLLCKCLNLVLILIV